MSEENLTSNEISKKLKKIEELKITLENVRKEISEEQETFATLDAEYGSEIARVKKEFSRMKERSYEEATEISNAAKLAALKEVLPITGVYIFYNYFANLNI